MTSSQLSLKHDNLNQNLIFTLRECGVVIVSVAFVCVSVCLSVCPVRVLIYERLDVETSFLVRWYIFRISRSSSYVEVIGSRSRSHEQKTVSTSVHVAKCLIDVSSLKALAVRQHYCLTS